MIVLTGLRGKVEKEKGISKDGKTEYPKFVIENEQYVYVNPDYIMTCSWINNSECTEIVLAVANGYLFVKEHPSEVARLINELKAESY